MATRNVCVSAHFHCRRLDASEATNMGLQEHAGLEQDGHSILSGNFAAVALCFLDMGEEKVSNRSTGLVSSGSDIRTAAYTCFVFSPG
jgi:hypothetical protein